MIRAEELFREAVVDNPCRAVYWENLAKAVAMNPLSARLPASEMVSRLYESQEIFEFAYRFDPTLVRGRQSFNLVKVKLNDFGAKGIDYSKILREKDTTFSLSSSTLRNLHE